MLTHEVTIIAEGRILAFADGTQFNTALITGVHVLPEYAGNPKRIRINLVDTTIMLVEYSDTALHTLREAHVLGSQQAANEQSATIKAFFREVAPGSTPGEFVRAQVQTFAKKFAVEAVAQVVGGSSPRDFIRSLVMSYADRMRAK